MFIRSHRVARFLSGLFRFIHIGSIILLIFFIPAMLFFWFATGTFDFERQMVINGQHVGSAWRPVIGTLIMIASVWLAAAIALSTRLRAMMRSVVDGTPFIIENVARLRAIAVILGVLNLFNAFSGLLISVADRKTYDIDVDGGFDLGLFIGMLVVIVLAEVFREGVALREDVEGTI